MTQDRQDIQDMQAIDEALVRHGRGEPAVIPILQAIQDHYGYLPRVALEHVCRNSEITPAMIAGVSTFYSQFRHRPVGRHMISVCHGTACHVKGADQIHDAFRQKLGLAGEADTDEKGLFTLQKVACLGCCTLAPAVQIDHVTYGHLTAQQVPRVLQDFLELQKRRPRQSAKAAGGVAGGAGEIHVGLGSCCVARGSAAVEEALQEAILSIGAQASIKRVGCVGMCHQTPLVEVVIPGRPDALYAQVQPGDARDIVARHFHPHGLVRRTCGSAWRKISEGLDSLLGEAKEPLERHLIEKRDPPVAAFLGPQKHIATEHCGEMDPLDVVDYIRRGGFEALGRAKAMTPQALIEEVRQSGLAGRGGAGFGTGVKWSLVAAAAGTPKYVVCNGDEGDPGAFMDRMLLESYPYRVLEGLLIAAHAVGSSEIILYIRAEYPLAVQRVNQAISILQEHAQKDAALGRLVAGTSLKVFQGAGAFVCGEETALIASIEGRRGMPRLRPPYPAQQGLWGKPTLVNNVETMAMVPWIIRNGSAALAALGTAGSKGTKVFALAGKVTRGGLVEVPMGVTIRQIVEEVGGGVGGGKRFKAVQIGGPSGGCLGEAQFDTQVDYKALIASGAIMGSGGLVVLDESDCMVDIARYFLQFTQNQSCGRCTFCRIGTRRMLDILEGLCEGKARPGDVEELERLALLVKKGSLCGLGKTAPNPVLSTIKHFRDEYQAHLEGCCPAGKCKALIRFEITDDCIGCTICAQRCPVDAIAMRPYCKHEIDQEKCTRCGTCKAVCPSHAVAVVSDGKAQNPGGRAGLKVTE